MRMSRGQSDDEPANQVARMPRTRASATHSLSTAIYYNRLESCRSFRLLYAASRASVCTPIADANPSSRDAAVAPNHILASRTFLSLVQGRESCHKQLWGVTPFRRGTA
jgi:hypothetical protein